MSDVTGKGLAQFFRDLLKIENGNGGVDGTLRRVETGNGAVTALSLATDKAQIDGSLKVNGPITAEHVAGVISNLGLSIDGGGEVLTVGMRGDFRVPWDCEILEVAAFSEIQGSVVLDLRKSTTATYPAFAGSICGGSKITLTNAYSHVDAALVGWTKTLTKGDILRPYVESVSAVKFLTVNIWVRKL